MGWEPIDHGSTFGIWLGGWLDLILASGWMGDGGLGYEHVSGVGAHLSGNYFWHLVGRVVGSNTGIWMGWSWDMS